jgi:hypothetical protein
MSATAGGLLWLLNDSGNLIKLLVVIPAAAGVYVLIAKLLKVQELAFLMGRQRKQTSA